MHASFPLGVSAPRADFLKRSALVGGAALAVGALAGAPGALRAQGGGDARALDLLLLVEYTEDAFYSEAVARANLTAELRDFAVQVAEQEREHLQFVKDALGSRAASRPDFDFGDSTRSPEAFAAAAARLEDLAVSAYNGQATNVSRKTLGAAATIVSVEARHAAWVRSIAGEPPAPDATDAGMKADAVLDALAEIGLRR